MRSNSYIINKTQARFLRAFFMKNKRKIFRQHKEIIADFLTPVGVYSNLRDRFENPLLLESADFHDRSDSKSYICLSPLADFEAKGLEVRISDDEHQGTQAFNNQKEVYRAFQDFHSSFLTADKEVPGFSTLGLFGYSSFESLQYMEDLSFSTASNRIKDNPDMKYQFFRFVLVFDHFKNTLRIVEHRFDDDNFPKHSIDEVLQYIQTANGHPFGFNLKDKESANMPDDRFLDMVRSGVDYCQQGDVFQVVLSRSFRQSFTGDEFNVYRALRSLNPSPYLFYFDYGAFRIFGSSPEAQLQVNQHQQSSLNPIAGTVRRTGNAEKDALLAKELLDDPKEKSEHVMLVDLARNDLSRSCSKVEVSSFSEVQYFSHVIHLVSKVNGTLSADKSALDVFADTFPAGTLSGAPKYRAVEIIKEQESENRNFYGGAIGFFGFDGSANKAIIIRSVLSKDNKLCYQAGAGVVIDSSPENELKEVDNKLAAIRLAIQKACEI